MIDVLSENTLRAAIKTDMPIRYFPTIDSTNTEARRLLRQGMTGSCLLVAGEQTAGRGRQGKHFYSPADTGIYFSLVLPWEKDMTDAVAVTTGTAVAVCRALEQLAGLTPQIKWVNDVYLNGKKVCGILTEAVTPPEIQQSHLIIGIGINITTAAFPQEIENAGALNKALNRAALVAAVCEALLQTVPEPFENYADYYRAHSLLTGKAIRFWQNGVATDATALGIDNTGGLIVRRTDGTLQTLRSGEITVREAKETT